MRALQISTVLLSLTAGGHLAQATATDQESKSDPSVSVVVGCLVRGLPGAERDDPAARKTMDYFVRTPTVVLPVGTAITVGQPSTPGATVPAGKPAADSYYRLTGIGAGELQAHLNHRVEVRGHLVPAKGDATARSVTVPKTTVDAEGTATGTAETRGFIAGDLHATAVKMISATCP